MIYNSRASYLTESEWNSTARYLEPFIDEFLLTAKRLKLDCQRSQRWPMLTLSDSGLCNISEFKFSLNSGYMQDGEIFFELIHQRFIKKCLIKKNTIETTVLATYTLDDLQNVQRVMESVEEKITENPENRRKPGTDHN